MWSAVIYWSTGSTTSLSVFCGGGSLSKDVIEKSEKLKGKSVGKCCRRILSTGKQCLHSGCSMSLIRFLRNYLQVNGRRQWWAWLPILLWLDHSDHAAKVNRTGKDPVLPPDWWHQWCSNQGELLVVPRQPHLAVCFFYSIAFTESLFRFKIKCSELLSKCKKELFFFFVLAKMYILGMLHRQSFLQIINEQSICVCIVFVHPNKICLYFE